MSDDAVLQIPLFQGDYWSKVLESKCKDLFESGESPFDPTAPFDGKKQKRGKLCGRYLREEDHFSIDIPPQIKSTHNNNIPSDVYICKSCVPIHFSQSDPHHMHPRKTVHLVDMNPLFTSPIFSDRHVFLGFCQENHFEFSEVSDIC